MTTTPEPSRTGEDSGNGKGISAAFGAGALPPEEASPIAVKAKEHHIQVSLYKIHFKSEVEN